MGRPGDDDDAAFFAEEFAAVRRMLQGRTVEEFSQLPLMQRKSVFSQYLVQPQRVIIEEGDDDNTMNPQIAEGVLLLQQLFMGKDEKGKQMVKEAREVYYGENEFWVRLHWLCEFRCDQYDFGIILPVAPLVRRLIVETDLHTGYDHEHDTDDNPLYPYDGIGDREENIDPNHIRPSADIVARRTRKRLEELFLFINAEEITLVLRGSGPLDGSDTATRQTIADISVTVNRLIKFFGNRFAIEKWSNNTRSPSTRSLVSYWNKPTDLTRRDVKEGRASFQQQMQMDVERWTREPVTIESRS
jgi:hypothetical protein